MIIIHPIFLVNTARLSEKILSHTIIIKASLFLLERREFQNDFAARMDWCTKPYSDANHPPVPMLEQPDQITVKSGDTYTKGKWLN